MTEDLDEVELNRALKKELFDSTEREAYVADLLGLLKRGTKFGTSIKSHLRKELLQSGLLDTLRMEAEELLDSGKVGPQDFDKLVTELFNIAKESIPKSIEADMKIFIYNMLKRNPAAAREDADKEDTTLPSEPM